MYRVTHLLANLGWADFDLGCSKAGGPPKELLLHRASYPRTSSGLEVLRFRDWNRNRIFIIFQELIIPIPIPIPAKIDFLTVLDGTGIDSKMDLIPIPIPILIPEKKPES